MTKIYLAYGSNLNMRQMRQRCPRATPIAKFLLQDWRLVFRGVADIIEEPGAEVAVGAWRITRECEAALDRYEGFRAHDPEGSMYRKVYIDMNEPISGEHRVMFYTMNSTGIMPPSEGYFDSILEGYNDFRLPRKLLFAALRASYDDKAPSHIERQRHRRNGRPQLAVLPTKKPKSKKVKTTAPTIEVKAAPLPLFDHSNMVVYGD